MAARKTAVETAVLNGCNIVARLDAQLILERIEELNFFEGFGDSVPVCSCEKCDKTFVGIGSFAQHYAKCVCSSHETSGDISCKRDYGTAYTIFHNLVFAELSTTFSSQWNPSVSQKTRTYFAGAPLSVTSVFMEVAAELDMMRYRTKLFSDLRSPKKDSVSESERFGHPSRKRPTTDGLQHDQEKSKPATKRRRPNSEVSASGSETLNVFDAQNEEAANKSQVEISEEASVSDSENKPGGEYKVEGILDKRRRKDYKTGRMISQYLVKWVGYDESQSTWEPIENLEGCSETVEKFEEERKKSKDLALKSKRSSRSSNFSCSSTVATQSMEQTPSSTGRRGRRSRIRLTVDQDNRAAADASSITSLVDRNERAGVVETREGVECHVVEMSSSIPTDVLDVPDTQPTTTTTPQPVQDVTDFLEDSSYLHEPRVPECEHVLLHNVYITPSPDEDHSQPEISSSSVRVLSYPDAILPSYAVEVSASFSSEDGANEAWEVCDQVARNGVNAKRASAIESIEQRADQRKIDSAQNSLHVLEMEEKSGREILKSNGVRKRVRSGMSTGGKWREYWNQRSEVMERLRVRKANDCLRKPRAMNGEKELDDYGKGSKERLEESRCKQGAKNGARKTGKIGNDENETCTRIVEKERTYQDGYSTSGSNQHEDSGEMDLKKQTVSEHMNSSLGNRVVTEEGVNSSVELIPNEDATENQVPSVEDLGGEMEDSQKDGKHGKVNEEVLIPEERLPLRTKGIVADRRATQVGMSSDEEEDRPNMIDWPKSDKQQICENGYTPEDAISASFKADDIIESLNPSVDDQAKERGLPRVTWPNPKGGDLGMMVRQINPKTGQTEESAEVRRDSGEALDLKAARIGNGEVFETIGVLVVEGMSSSDEEGRLTKSKQKAKSKMGKESYNENGCSTEDAIGVDSEELSVCDLGSPAEGDGAIAEEYNFATEEMDCQKEDIGISRGVEYVDEGIEEIRREDGLRKEHEERVRVNGSASDRNVATLPQGRQLLSKEGVSKTEDSAEEVLQSYEGATVSNEMDSDLDEEDDVLSIHVSEDDVDVIFRSPPAAAPMSEAEKLRSILRHKRDESQAIVGKKEEPCTTELRNVHRANVPCGLSKAQTSVRRTQNGVSQEKIIKHPSPMVERRVSATGTVYRVVMPNKQCLTPGIVKKVMFADENECHSPKVPPKCGGNQPGTCPERPAYTEPETPGRPVGHKNVSMPTNSAESMTASGSHRRSEPARRGRDSVPMSRSSGKEVARTRKPEPAKEFIRSCCNHTNTMATKTVRPEQVMGASQKRVVKPTTKNVLSKADTLKSEVESTSEGMRREGMPDEMAVAEVRTKGKRQVSLPKRATELGSKASAVPVSVEKAGGANKLSREVRVVLEKTPNVKSDITTARKRGRPMLETTGSKFGSCPTKKADVSQEMNPKEA